MFISCTYDIYTQNLKAFKIIQQGYGDINNLHYFYKCRDSTTPTESLKPYYINYAVLVQLTTNNTIIKPCVAKKTLTVFLQYVDKKRFTIFI